MRSIKQLAAVLVAQDPRGAADRVLGFLLADMQARAGAVLSVDGDRPSLFVSRSLGLDGLEGLRAAWSAHRRALEQGRLVPGRQTFVPVMEDSDLVGILYLDSPAEFDAEGVAVFGVSLAKALLAARSKSAPFEAYLASSRVEDIEREQLAIVLRDSEWNIARAARILGVTRRTVYLRLQRFGLKRKRIRKASRRREAPA